MTAPNSTAPPQPPAPPPAPPPAEPQAARPLDARALLELLERRGARLEARGDRLAVDAPRSLIGAFAGDIQRFKPQLLELLAPIGSASGSDMGDDRQRDDDSDTGDDARALELLARYRRGGVLLCLEEIEHKGAAWLSLACDLTGVARAPLRRSNATRASCSARGWLAMRVNSGAFRTENGDFFRAYLIAGAPDESAGFPDVLAMRARPGCAVELRLFEVKRRGGKRTPEQRRFAAFALARGVAVEVVSVAAGLEALEL